MVHIHAGDIFPFKILISHKGGNVVWKARGKCVGQDIAPVIAYDEICDDILAIAKLCIIGNGG